MKRIPAALFVLRAALRASLVLVGVSGCSSFDGTAPGKLGNARFSYTGVIWGDGSHDPAGRLSLNPGGARQAIAVQTDQSFASVASSDPSVATFVMQSSTVIEAKTGVPGKADLQLLRADGSLLDEITLTVAAPDGLMFGHWHGTREKKITLVDGAEQTIPVCAENREGSFPSLGRGAVRLDASGSLSTITPDDTNSANWAAFGYDVIRVHAERPGGAITATLGAVSERLEVNVIPVDQIFATIAIAGRPYEGAEDLPWSVEVKSMAPDGSAMQGLDCDWRFSDTSTKVVRRGFGLPIPNDPATVNPEYGPGSTTLAVVELIPSTTNPPVTVFCQLGPTTYSITLR